MLPVTSIYAGTLSLAFVFLSMRIIILRGRFKVLMGDEGHAEIQRAIRAQGNFSEYVPLALLLLATLELNQVVPWLLHAIGVCLILGRMIHAYNISRVSEELKIRVVGMLLTFLSIIVASVAAIIVGVVSVFP